MILEFNNGDIYRDGKKVGGVISVNNNMQRGGPMESEVVLKLVDQGDFLNVATRTFMKTSIDFKFHPYSMKEVSNKKIKEKYKEKVEGIVDGLA